MKKIIVLGDSHSQLFANLPLLDRGVWIDSNLQNIFDVQWMGPVTYWRLSRDQSEFINFDNGIRYTNKDKAVVNIDSTSFSDVMISLGEIDVRSNILIHHPINYQEGADIILQGIEKFISDNRDKLQLHLISIIPPIRREDNKHHDNSFPIIGTDEDRSKLTVYLNQGLEKITEKYSIGFFDMYSLYADKEGCLKPELSDNIVHAIKTPELENLIKMHFNF